MKKNVGFKNNNNPRNKRMSLISKNKKLNDETNTFNILKENQIKTEDIPKSNLINKSIDNKRIRNKEKKNYQNKKIKKLSNKSSLSKLDENNKSEEPKDYDNFNRQNKYFHNNKNNSVIISNIDNIYNENNIKANALKEESLRNKDGKKYKNGSTCNIRVNKPIQLILDKNIILNEIGNDKSFKINNNYTSATYKIKKDLNKTFNLQDNDNNPQNLKFNNKQKNIKEHIISLKENINNIKNKFEEINLHKNNFKNPINIHKNKSLMRFNTSNNLSYKRENSNNNEVNKSRMKSIDNYDKLNLNKKIKKKNLKLNHNQMNDSDSLSKRLLSPNFFNLENFKKQFFNNVQENNLDMEDVTHMDLLKLSMRE